jgi:hypothetical protein
MATGKGNTWINDYLKLVFNAVAVANIADNAAASPLTNLFLSLHTADPGAGGSQTTSEAAYTSYARVPIARTSGGFTVSGQTVTLAATASFPAGTGGGEACTYVAIGTLVSGAGKILYRAQLSATINTGVGVTPQISTSTGLTES